MAAAAGRVAVLGGTGALGRLVWPHILEAQPVSLLARGGQVSPSQPPTRCSLSPSLTLPARYLLLPTGARRQPAWWQCPEGRSNGRRRRRVRPRGVGGGPRRRGHPVLRADASPA